ncbi:MAG: hypothetical protein KAR20_27920, partial [Candidatus Heimdallarchaeota archaeon]|nr:hypothetical protein [Candidatus Heimdallarchaeota archaeon]
KFVELSRAIPSKLKTKGGDTKYILKKAVEGLIPDNIIYRKKQGFNAPIEEWFSNELSGLLSDVLLRSSIRKRDLFDYDYIEKIINRFKTDKDSKVYREYMWVLFNLFLWYDYWIEQEDIEQKYKLTSYMKNTGHL